ncbi:MAG TPA: prepilin-type N-terminal cleavage/methylation domain-containing protein, partial [Candidatus Omnitrophota bacterium]|nr:prepilin-type N-terminal cleavage/methylation domain-containing protein [Candidatus Omnitrophota bacterium]
MKKLKIEKGFTLIEMIMVVVLVSILGSIAYPRYLRTVERGRTAEARQILGRIKSAETAYMLEWDSYTGSFTSLSISVPVNACNSSYYYRYCISAN